MSTLTEIEQAAKQLSDDEKRQLLISVVSSLRRQSDAVPPPRKFAPEQIKAWLDEDERDGREFMARK